MECLVVTGMSGAGKSTAIHALEDLGYYCADNIPAQLVEVFFKLCETSDNKEGKFAAVVDVRGFSKFSFDAHQLKERLSLMRPLPKILYVDATDEIILNRYKETRRRHPVLDDEFKTLEEAVDAERHILTGLREMADYVIDTTTIPTADFKERIRQIVSIKNDECMSVLVSSFGFKNGIPRDADMVFDVRCLPNPFYITELKDKTGKDKEVYDYVFSFNEAEILYEKIKDFIYFSLPLYKKEGKSRLVISFGCTGGHHRSVAFAQRLQQDLNKTRCFASINHRDIER